MTTHTSQLENVGFLPEADAARIDAVSLTIRIAELCGPVPANGAKAEWNQRVLDTIGFLRDEAAPLLQPDPAVANAQERIAALKDTFEEVMAGPNTEYYRVRLGVLLGAAKHPNGPTVHIAVQGPYGLETLPHDEAVALWQKHCFEKEAFKRDTGILSWQHGIDRFFVPHVINPEGAYIYSQLEKLTGSPVLVYSCLEEYPVKTGELRKRRMVRHIEPAPVPAEQIVSYGFRREPSPPPAAASAVPAAGVPPAAAASAVPPAAVPAAPAAAAAAPGGVPGRAAVTSAYQGLRFWAMKSGLVNQAELIEVMTALGYTPESLTGGQAAELKDFYENPASDV